MTQRHFCILSFSFFCLGLLSLSAYAAPLIWETDFGSEVTPLTGQDDLTQQVSLNFNFTFFGTDYTELFVSTNGLITLGADTGPPYAPNVPEDFLNASVPIIAPFWSDLDLTAMGQVFFNEFDDRAVITWSAVGSFIDSLAAFTFQVQLMADGRVIFGYNRIGDTLLKLDEDLVVGLSRGNGTGTATRMDYTDGPLYQPTLSGAAYQLTMRSTVYEVFDLGAKPFDLDGGNLIFTPPFLPPPILRTSLFSPPSPPPPLPSAVETVIPEPGSLVLVIAGLLFIIGLGWRGILPQKMGQNAPPAQPSTWT